MTYLIHQPQDKLFKQALSDIRVAKEFFVEHVPAELLKIVDLDSLRLEKQSFIDEAYKATEADMLYSVKLLGGGIGYLYLLCEHQSAVDKMISFRLLVYRVRILEQYLKQYPGEDLPVVYSMVVYTGKPLWTAPLDFYELFGERSDLAREILLQPTNLVDVQRLEDDELQDRRWSGLVEFALKYREVRDFALLLETLLPWLQEIEVEGGTSYVRSVLKYVLDGIESQEIDIFIEKTKRYLDAGLQEAAMTLAQQFELRGMERGMQQGVQEGMQQGMQQIIANMLQQGLSLAEIANLSGLSVTEIEALFAETSV